MDKPISMRDKMLQLEAQVEALTKIIAGALNKNLEEIVPEYEIADATKDLAIK